MKEAGRSVFFVTIFIFDKKNHIKKLVDRLLLKGQKPIKMTIQNVDGRFLMVFCALS